MQWSPSPLQFPENRFLVARDCTECIATRRNIGKASRHNVNGSSECWRRLTGVPPEWEGVVIELSYVCILLETAASKHIASRESKTIDTGRVG